MKQSTDRTGRQLRVLLLDLAPALLEQDPGVHPVLLRVARTLSAGAQVYIARWHQAVLQRDGIFVDGPVIALGGEEPVLSRVPERLAFDACWFYPCADSGMAGQNPPEEAALRRLAEAAIPIASTRRIDVVAQLLLQAARRGVVSNAPGPLGRWGMKDHLAAALCWYERVSGSRLPYPETHVVLGAQVAAVVHGFGSREQSCILKPPSGARGEGVQIVPPGGQLQPCIPEAPVVVQELVSSPLLINERKADLRIYLLIDGRERTASRRLSPIFVRLGAARYVAAAERAEITNTSYRKRLGLPPSIHPLDRVTLLPESLRRQMVGALDELSEVLLDALFHWIEVHDWKGHAGARRILVWGLDVIFGRVNESWCPFLLEVNVYPQLYRDDPVCDGIIDEMLVREYLPAVRRAAMTPAEAPMVRECA